MATALKKIVVFLALIAFALSSIIGLVSGNHVPTIVFRSFAAFLLVVSVGWLLIPLFVSLWGEDGPEENESAMLDEEEPFKDAK